MKKLKRYIILVLEKNPEIVTKFQALLSNWPHLVYFCTTVQEAMGIMAGVSPDILFIDFRTPDLNCYEFVAHIQKKAPHSLRICYSEFEDKEALLKIVDEGFVHRCFSLPWDEHDVEKIISHDLQTRSRVRIRKCWDFLESGRGLPVMPSVASELAQVVRDPDYSLDDVARVIEKDPAISARLLRIVNSSAYVKSGRIVDIRHAVSYLGVNLTRNLVLFICAVKSFLYPKRYHDLALQIIQHCFNCSKLSEVIARDMCPEKVKSAATAALLHDIGKLLILSCQPEKNIVSGGPVYSLETTSVKEMQWFGITHLELGSALLLWWNLPLEIADVAANHALPLSELDGVSRCVSAADRCLNEIIRGSAYTSDLDSLKEFYPIENWRQQAREILAT